MSHPPWSGLSNALAPFDPTCPDESRPVAEGENGVDNKIALEDKAPEVMSLRKFFKRLSRNIPSHVQHIDSESPAAAAATTGDGLSSSSSSSNITSINISRDSWETGVAFGQNEICPEITQHGELWSHQDFWSGCVQRGAGVVDKGRSHNI